VSPGGALGLEEILLAPTPAGWVDAAVERWPELLLDHANCEKKAASSALALIFTYPEDRALGRVLSRLAREELRHFEQVQSLIQSLGVPFRRLEPGRYAAGLRAALARAEPGRKLDLLLAGALIEARSCERFRLLAPRLSGALGKLYGELERAESRHFGEYLELARLAAQAEWRPRLAVLARREAELATAPDTALRFHSGVPSNNSLQAGQGPALSLLPSDSGGPRP
jgi:tRNA 2-(methylsulfanyl)-N6-isopentenyladenosine37 hydroxylase